MKPRDSDDLAHELSASDDEENGHHREIKRLGKLISNSKRVQERELLMSMRRKFHTAVRQKNVLGGQCLAVSPGGICILHCVAVRSLFVRLHAEYTTRNSLLL
eukprot:GHVU01104864.1.p2 GENE.GHVU01104864.1~~GHVU01104864.1.p2  ORF type:complete len:103 (-),score=3.51 GHVU01104864.1:845-1153(-)